MSSGRNKELATLTSKSQMIYFFFFSLKVFLETVWCQQAVKHKNVFFFFSPFRHWLDTSMQSNILFNCPVTTSDSSLSPGLKLALSNSIEVWATRLLFTPVSDSEKTACDDWVLFRHLSSHKLCAVTCHDRRSVSPLTRVWLQFASWISKGGAECADCAPHNVSGMFACFGLSWSFLGAEHQPPLWETKSHLSALNRKKELHHDEALSAPVFSILLTPCGGGEACRSNRLQR